MTLTKWKKRCHILTWNYNIFLHHTQYCWPTLRDCIDVFRFHCATHVWIERNNLLMNCKESFIPNATTVLKNKANSVPQHWTDIAASIFLSHVVYQWSWSLTVHEEKRKNSNKTCVTGRIPTDNKSSPLPRDSLESVSQPLFIMLHLLNWSLYWAILW